MKKGKRRIISFLLALSMLMSAAVPGIQAQAAEQQEAEQQTENVQIKPDKYPAEGIIPVCIAGSMDVVHELPVLVTEFGVVLGDLEELGKLLGLELFYNGNTAQAQIYNRFVYMYANTGYARYQNNYFALQIYLGAPVIKQEEKFFVPLRGFLEAMGADSLVKPVEGGTNNCYAIVPPQKTLMDYLTEIESQKDRYRFGFQKDFGLTEDSLYKMGLSGSLVQTINNIWNLDFYTLADMANLDFFMGDFWGEEAYFTEKKYMMSYMNVLLAKSELEFEAEGKLESNLMNLCTMMVDAAKEVGGKSPKAVWENVKTWWGKGSAAMTQKAVEKNFFKKIGKAAQNLDKTELATGGAVLAADVLMAGTRLYLRYSDEEEFVQGGAKAFLDYAGSKEMLSKGQKEASKEALDRFMRESKGSAACNAFKWEEGLSTATSAAGLFSKGAGTLAFASGAWKLTGQLLYADGLDKTGQFMAAVMGQSYQKAALDYAVGESKEIFWAANPSEEEIDLLRSKVYHGLKSAYVTRCMAMESVSDVPQKSVQEGINQEILDMMAVMKCDSIEVGKLPMDMYELAAGQEDLLPLVRYFLAKISGTVYNRETEEPQKKVKVAIQDEDGKVLAEFETDEEGFYETTVPLDMKKMLTDGSDVLCKRKMVLKYKKYPDEELELELKMGEIQGIEDLYVGYVTENFYALLQDAKEEDGKSKLLLQPLIINEALIDMDVPVNFSFDKTVRALGVFKDQLEYDGPATYFPLKKNTTFETFYSMSIPERGFTSSLINVMEAGTGQTVIPKALRKGNLHDAADIKAFIEESTKIEGHVPCFYVEVVDSQIKYMEPVVLSVG